MNEFLTIVSAVIPVLGLAVAGFLLRKLNWLSEEADASLLRLTINLLLPCLILQSVMGNPAVTRWENLAVAPLVGFGTAAGGMLLARLLARVAGLREARSARTFSLTVGLYNYGFIPIPLAVLLFDKETTGVLLVHNVGVEISLWTIGLMMLTGSSAAGSWRKIINAPLMAMTLALLLNFTGWNEQVPAVVTTLTDLLAQCAIPLSLLLIGATVADHLVHFRLSSAWRVIGVAVFLRIGLLPLGFLLLATLLPVSAELKRVMVLEAAMASAVFPIVMTKHYGGDTRTALEVILGTSLVGVITTPLWIRFGMKMVGL